jgi:hypothetical protein
MIMFGIIRVEWFYMEKFQNENCGNSEVLIETAYGNDNKKFFQQLLKFLRSSTSARFKFSKLSQNFRLAYKAVGFYFCNKLLADSKNLHVLCFWRSVSTARDHFRKKNWENLKILQVFNFFFYLVVKFDHQTCKFSKSVSDLLFKFRL